MPAYPSDKACGNLPLNALCLGANKGMFQAPPISCDRGSPTQPLSSDNWSIGLVFPRLPSGSMSIQLRICCIVSAFHTSSLHHLTFSVQLISQCMEPSITDFGSCSQSSRFCSRCATLTWNGSVKRSHPSLSIKCVNHFGSLSSFFNVHEYTEVATPKKLGIQSHPGAAEM